MLWNTCVKWPLPLAFKAICSNESKAEALVLKARGGI